LIALYSLYGKAGLNELILDGLGIKKDLTNALDGFEKSYVPFQLLVVALLFSFVLLLAPTVKTGKQAYEALHYHAFSEAMDRPEFGPRSHNARFWAKFVIRHAAALLLFHSQVVRKADPAKHSLRYEIRRN